MNYSKVFITGHRNPDMDSLAAAAALAELRRRQDLPMAEAICPGVMPERAHYVFSKFGVKEPLPRGDAYVRVADIMTPNPETVTAGTSLWHSMVQLKGSGFDRLPVVDADGGYIGMLSPMGMLDKLMMADQRNLGALSSRAIDSSINLITQVIQGEILTGYDVDRFQRFLVYVTAMSLEAMKQHLPNTVDYGEIALIVGDRPEIHQWALDSHVRLMIVTGDLPVSDDILARAAQEHVTIIRSPKDSAKAIRRLTFAGAVEHSGMRGGSLILTPEDRVRDIEEKVREHFEDDIPVVDAERRLIGILSKYDITQKKPFGIILVDHNEIEQSLPGIESLPVLEIVDHHRLRTVPTDHPIRFTADVVGSTCTLVARMYREAGQSLSPGMAGVLLAGITMDTLNLKSPTTADLDRRISAWLSGICGVTGEQLMDELAHIASPLSASGPAEVLEADRKTYTEGDFVFSLSQIEETNLQLLNDRLDELRTTMQSLMESEKLNFIALMVTDPVRLNSRLLALGDAKLLKCLPYRSLGNDLFDMPGILSRKKQLLPQVLLSIRERR